MEPEREVGSIIISGDLGEHLLLLTPTQAPSPSLASRVGEDLHRTDSFFSQNMPLEIFRNIVLTLVEEQSPP